jgi:amino acid transporter
MGSRTNSANGSQRSSAAQEPRASAEEAVHTGTSKRSLGVIGMIFLTFVSTAGGPFGIESMVQASGPIVTFAFILAVPVIIVLPTVLMVTELVAWMPSNHGSVRWVHRAFGPFLGFANGIFQLAMNFIDIAIYPTMSTNYFCRAFYPDATHTEKILLHIAITIVGTIPCLFRIKGVVVFCLVVAVAILIPFLVGFFGSVKHIDLYAWNNRFPADPEYATLLSTGIWLYNGFISNGSLAGEVTGYKVFLYGQLGALVLDVLMYALPLLVTLQVRGSWGDAYLVKAFNDVYPGLGMYVSIAGFASGFGLYLSSLACYSRTLWGAGDMRWVPHFFAKVHGGSPRIATLTLAATTIILGSVGGFNFLIDLEFSIASITYAMFAAAYVTLRYQYPDEERPYKVPGGKVTSWLMVTPIIIFMTSMMCSSLVAWPNLVAFCLTGVATGALYRFVYMPFLQSKAAEASAQRASENSVTTTLLCDDVQSHV